MLCIHYCYATGTLASLGTGLVKLKRRQTPPHYPIAESERVVDDFLWHDW